MKPVYQTIVSDKNGNCLQAAVASLLELDLNEVPHFVAAACEWRDELRRFLFDRRIHWLNIPFADEESVLRFRFNNPQLDCICLLEVKSFHFDCKHCVIARFSPPDGLEVIHDPNPENEIKTSSEYEIYEIDLFFPMQ